MPRIQTIVAALGFLVVLPGAAGAQGTTTAFLDREATTGLTKQCYYNALGSVHTLTMRSIDICPATTKVRTSPRARADREEHPPQPRKALVDDPTPSRSESGTITAFFKSESKPTGMTKQCNYDALGSIYTKTVRSIDVCPVTIKVRRQ